ncbi:hypothetical protein PIB30_079040 [Stylosanthes scabra]|uniref:Protein FAR1-RELATED SEQUENCE n=1 Tax=Stylosanthes scabra TaxID=79078 RepID=A0ABU6ZPK6_9FABA|nr:hypothetical protein [Stylosanthes scabra]
MWATTYIRGCFYAGLRMTSRCESLHAKLGRFVERRFGVHEWSKKVKVEKLMEAGRNREVLEESDSIYKTRVGAFLQLCKRFARLAYRDKTNYKNFSKKVVEGIRLLERRASSRGVELGDPLSWAMV